MYRVKKKNIKDIKYILNHLRKEDRIECKAVLGKNWKKENLNNIKKVLGSTLIAKTKNGNTPVLMCGACALNNRPDIAIVWMLSTPEIEKHQISFLREMKKEIQLYDEKYAITFNNIYKTNYLAKKWLKWAGFRFPEEEKVLTPMDKIFLSVEVPEGFEIFYRERPVKGLGE